jgi:hypothetical protein
MMSERFAPPQKRSKLPPEHSKSHRFSRARSIVYSRQILPSKSTAAFSKELFHAVLNISSTRPERTSSFHV